MIIEPAQATIWKKSFRIAFDCRDGDFLRERLKSGKLSSPRLPKKNEAHRRNASGGQRIAPAHRHFRQAVRAQLRALKLPVCLLPCRITVIQTHGQQREVAGRSYPRMDASATLEAVCDAVQTGKGFVHGLVSDDVQFVDRRAVGQYQKGVWCLRVEIEAMPQWGAG